MTDAGPLDLLVQLRDRDGGRHDYVELSARAVGYDVGDLTVRLAPLDDNVASKVFKWRTHADGSDPLPPLLIAGLEMSRLGIPIRTRLGHRSGTCRSEQNVRMRIVMWTVQPCAAAWSPGTKPS